LITEYIQRCQGYDGFFTRDNQAALTSNFTVHFGSKDACSSSVLATPTIGYST